MKSVLSEIFEGLETIDALAPHTPADAEYARVFDMEDEFEAALSAEMREKFLEIMSLKGEMDHESDRRLFIKGVRLGMQLMLDAMLERERKQ